MKNKSSGNFKAVLMDLDGTVTEMGAGAPDEAMIKTLIETSRKVPIGFCTGRALVSFERHFGKIYRHFEQLFVMAENGSLGYRFDHGADDFEEIYRVNWPDSLIAREEFIGRMGNLLEDLGYVNPEPLVSVVARVSHNFEEPVREIMKKSAEAYELMEKFLKKEFGPDFRKFLHIGDSGMGVVVIPAEGDKDRGIREMGKFLGIESSDVREIMAIGDNPQRGGNDHEFLKGVFGTPFNVGELDFHHQYPTAVIDRRGQRIFGPRATRFLLRKFFP